MNCVTRAVFARMCRVSRKTVTTWGHQGLLAMEGHLVNVDGTRENMKKYRRTVPIVLTAEEAAAPFPRGEVTPKSVTRDKKPSRATGPVSMLCTDIVAELEALDWKGEFEWTPDAQAERVRKAAECIGWEAVMSELRDDGHWGGFQLRIPEYLGPRGLTEDTIGAGFGFELCPGEALQAMRHAIEPCDDDDRETVRPELLSLLAHPWADYDTPD